jgi:hypothetical protein
MQYLKTQCKNAMQKRNAKTQFEMRHVNEPLEGGRSLRAKNMTDQGQYNKTFFIKTTMISN